MKQILFVLTLATLFGAMSCDVQRKRAQKCQKWGVCQSKDSVFIRDTIIPKADSIMVDNSAFWSSILFECDSSGHVLIKQIDSLNAVNVRLATSLKDNRLVQTVYVDGKTIYVPKYIHEKGETKTVTATTNELTRFQKFLFWSGVAFWVLLIIFAVVKVRKIVR